MIKAVIFDCFGVLYSGPFKSIVQMAPSEDRQRLKDLNTSNDYGYISHEEYIAGLAEALGQSQTATERFMRKMHVRNDELIGLLDSLRQEGYKTGLLSNVGYSVMQDLFTDEELAVYFDAYVFSSDEHMAKPNPAIFELMAERLGLTTSECVMIDDIEENCEGAEIAGMKSICHRANFETTEQLKILLRKTL